MRRSIRTRWLTAAAAAAALAALVSSAAAPAATDGAGTPTASHPCLVMTGSGDPAFVRNFNPFVGSLPSQGPQLGLEQRQQDPHPEPRAQRQVVRRQAADV